MLHKGKKIVLLPLTLAEIVKHDKELDEISKNDNALDSSATTTKEIKLKGCALIAITSLNVEHYVDGAPCRTMLTIFSRRVSPPHDYTTLSSKLHRAVPNILREFDGGMESMTTSIQEEEDDKDIIASDTYTLKSESSSTWTSFPSRILETIYTKNDATTTYEVCFMRSLYGWKYNFITFPMPPDSGT